MRTIGLELDVVGLGASTGETRWQRGPLLANNPLLLSSGEVLNVHENGLVNGFPALIKFS